MTLPIMHGTLPLLTSLATLLAPGSSSAPTHDLKDCCDSRSIQWIFPGNLSEARERCRRENRLLLIKGVSFGIDEEGLRSPTMGTW